MAPGFEQPYWILPFFILFLLGIASYFSKNRNAAFLFLAPFLITLLASALQKYPFSGRLIFFLVPFLALFIAEGMSLIYTLFVKTELSGRFACLHYGCSVTPWNTGLLFI